jgi:hypothetical protein
MLVITHDNNSEILAEIRKAKSVEKIHELATALGLVASHTFDMNWIALAESPTGEDIFMARNMDCFNFKGKDYPVRTFTVTSPEFGEEQTYMIGTDSLFEAFGDEYEKEGTEAHNIDNEIYFYVEDEVIGLDAEIICKEHLDIEMKFVEEIFE